MQDPAQFGNLITSAVETPTDNRETTMQRMRRFFCAWMDLKAGHTIQMLCVGADRRVRPQ